MQYKLSNVVLEDNQTMQAYTDLFVKTPAMPLFDEAGRFCMFRHVKYDFVTYLGSLSIGKWVEYAGVDNCHLHIDADGPYLIRIVAMDYIVDFQKAERNYVFLQEAYGPVDIDLTPYLGAVIIGFEMMPLGDTVFNEAYYYTEVDVARVRSVELAVAITTCRKEEYVTNNVRLLAGLAEGDEQIAGHIQVHVVDNGNTLEDLPTDNPKVFLHPNPNTGGAGGFARGMIESIEGEHGPEATHVLVMDDDVEILPEAFIRTYNLLTLVDEAHVQAVLAGAMLSIPVRDEQNEDVGHIDSSGIYGPVKTRRESDLIKGRLTMTNLDDMVGNETGSYNYHRQYSAFWYCCVPRETIERYGLPLPMYIRCDDAEFGMRDPDRVFMTMNGICVWHMSFGPRKFRASIECFYTVRNSLILAAVSPSFEGDGYLDMFSVLVENMIEREWRKFSYDNIELFLDGVDAYLAGPAYLIAEDAEAQFMEYGKRNVAPSELPGFKKTTARELYREDERSFFERAIQNATKNGHRFIPKRFVGGTGTAPDNFWDAPNPQIFLKDRVYLVEDDGVTGRLQVRDQARFDELWRRYTSVRKRYWNEHEAVEKEWKEAFPYLVSVEFWKRYLDEQREYADARRAQDQ